VAASNQAKIMELSLGTGGGTVHAEVLALDGPDPSGDWAADGGDAAFRGTAAKVGEAVALQMDEVRTLVRGMGDWAERTIEGAGTCAPDQFEVAFGLKLAAKSGHLIGIIAADVGGEASLTVRMSWDLAARRAAGRGGHGAVGEGGPAPEGGGAEESGQAGETAVTIEIAGPVEAAEVSTDRGGPDGAL
jgi:hypothetical protein